MRTSTGIASVAPTGIASRSCSTRSNLICSERRHLADLIEEEAPAAGSREQSLLVAHRPGKRTLHVPEQLALEQVFRQGAAVDRETGSVGPVGEAVDVTGEDFLTGPALSREQDCRVGRSDLLGKLEDFVEPLGFSDRPDDAGPVPAADLLLQVLVLDPNRAVIAGPAQNSDQFVVGERLLDVVERALVDCLNRGLQRGLGRHQDHRRHRVLLPDRVQDVDAGHLRHSHVGQDDVVGAAADLVQAGLSTLRGEDLEALFLEQDPQCIEDARLVVDDQTPLVSDSCH